MCVCSHSYSVGSKIEEKSPRQNTIKKRKQNVSKKEQKLPRVRGEHFLGLWIHLAAASSQKQQAAAGAAAAAATAAGAAASTVSALAQSIG